MRYENGHYEEAEQVCRALLSESSPPGRAFFLLGLIANKSGRHAESVKWLESAAERMPPSVRLLSALGGAYHAAGNLRRAAECFSRCLELDPQCGPAAHKLADVWYELHEFELAVRAYQQAAKLAPDNAAIWNNLGKNLRNVDRPDEALAAYARAVTLAPDDPAIHTNLGSALLTAGRLKEDFREHALTRQLHRSHGANRHPESGARQIGRQPLWKGERCKTLLIFSKLWQGMGDTIQFARYLGRAAQRVDRIVLECQAPLQALLEHSLRIENVTVTSEAPPQYDAWANLLDLPVIFETTLETIPAEMPYLATDRQVALPVTPASHLKVGLAWAGNPDFADDAHRSMPLEQLARLLEIDGISFFSLQKDLPSRDETFYQSARMIKIMDLMKDFADTAAIVSQLDLVVSVDTAVAHLAGALGKSVWLLLPRPADGRWLLERRDTPWYPTMRLFRQPRTGNWQAVVVEVAAELQSLVPDAPARMNAIKGLELGLNANLKTFQKAEICG